MHFALVDNKREEAKQGLKGICPICSQSVIPKCGNQKIHHWAHVAKKMCDHWWEPETEWHRKWKDLFPQENQEIIQFDEVTGEKHIADIRVNDIIIEFQHSHITTEERESREKFYKKMFWVVDGTRLQRDFPRFQNAFKDRMIYPTRYKGIYFISLLEECFPKDWLQSKVPIIFDFKGLLINEEQNPFREYLWCLLPHDNTRRQEVRGGSRYTITVRDVLVQISKEEFIIKPNNLYEFLFKKN